METVKPAIEVDSENLRVKGQYVQGKLRLKFGEEVLPPTAKAEHVAIVLAALIQAALAVLGEETERAPVVMEKSLAAVLIENAGAGRLDVMGFALAPKGGDSKQTGFWHVQGREFLLALMAGADQIVRACVTRDWQGEDISVLISLSIAMKLWLDENKDGAKAPSQD